jgi:hypothetical protein
MPQGMQSGEFMHTADGGVDRDACPLHSTSSTDAAHVKTAPGNTPGKHDCCKSSCQCQCGTLSLAFDFSVTRGLPVIAYVQPANVSHVVSAPADTHFRPPIAA